MTPAQVYKTSPISSNDSFDVVDEDDQVDQGSRGKEERKAAPDASLFVALSDIEEALKSTAADVERRKKERQPQTQTQNKILDVFRSDKSGEGMAKKAHVSSCQWFILNVNLTSHSRRGRLMLSLPIINILIAIQIHLAQQAGGRYAELTRST